MSAIVLENGMVHYEVLGRGRPIIFLHSWVGSWRYWIPTMQSLSTNYRTYALDLWGFGESAKGNQNYTISQQMDLLSRFLNEMGIIKAAIIGHGWGSIVALNFTAFEPTRVDRIMMVGYPLASKYLNPGLENQSTTELSDWLLGEDPNYYSVRLEATKADEDAIHTSVAQAQKIDLSGLYGDLDIASLLVYGRDDPAIQYPKDLDETHLPALGHQVVFNESGHFPMLDETNKFNRLVADFMALESGISPRNLQLKEEWKRRVR